MTNKSCDSKQVIIIAKAINKSDTDGFLGFLGCLCALIVGIYIWYSAVHYLTYHRYIPVIPSKYCAKHTCSPEWLNTSSSIIMSFLSISCVLFAVGIILVLVLWVIEDINIIRQNKGFKKTWTYEILTIIFAVIVIFIALTLLVYTNLWILSNIIDLCLGDEKDNISERIAIGLVFSVIELFAFGILSCMIICGCIPFYKKAKKQIEIDLEAARTKDE